MLRERSSALHWILNGVDYNEWDPKADKLLPATFSSRSMAGKAACKAALQERAKLAVKPDVPPALDAVCRQAMALKPEERYPMPLALAADVEAWLADEPVAAYAQPRAARVAASSGFICRAEV